MKTLVLEFGKEFLRIFILAIIPVAVSQLESGKIDYRLLIVGGIIAVLKAVDKSLHEVGKKEENVQLTKGIVQF